MPGCNMQLWISQHISRIMFMHCQGNDLACHPTTLRDILGGGQS
jgi:hypothetical protein